MSIVIPYDPDLEHLLGAFISPGGEIIRCANMHETSARKYCDGELFNMLSKFIYYEKRPNIPVPFDYGTRDMWFDVLKRDYNYQGTKEEIDEYSSSPLTSEQLKLYKKFIIQYMKYGTIWSDFLVQVLAYDKVETQLHKTISTTSPNPYNRFYNYCLMDWNILSMYALKYNEELGIFVVDDSRCFTDEDRETFEEIERIQEEVDLKDRHYYFK